MDKDYSYYDTLEGLRDMAREAGLSPAQVDVWVYHAYERVSKDKPLPCTNSVCAK